MVIGEYAMGNGLNAVARYNELYTTYLNDMQKPKYSANPDSVDSDALLRDLYKVVCGNGNARKSILHWSVDNGARLTIASEDMNAIQVTLAEHSKRLKDQEDICLLNRGIHQPKAHSSSFDQPQPATVVNVSSAPVVKSQSSFMGFVQTIKNVKDVVNVSIMLTTAIIIILGFIHSAKPAPIVKGLTAEQAVDIVKTMMAQQSSHPGKNP